MNAFLPILIFILLQGLPVQTRASVWQGHQSVAHSRGELNCPYRELNLGWAPERPILSTEDVPSARRLVIEKARSGNYAEPTTESDRVRDGPNS